MGDYIRSYSISQFQKTYSLPEVSAPLRSCLVIHYVLSECDRLNVCVFVRLHGCKCLRRLLEPEMGGGEPPDVHASEETRVLSKSSKSSATEPSVQP